MVEWAAVQTGLFESRTPPRAFGPSRPTSEARYSGGHRKHDGPSDHDAKGTNPGVESQSTQDMPKMHGSMTTVEATMPQPDKASPCAGGTTTRTESQSPRKWSDHKRLLPKASKSESAPINSWCQRPPSQLNWASSIPGRNTLTNTQTQLMAQMPGP